MSKHFIYHIFGKKVGVTNDIVRRMREQSVKEGEYEILEEHTNAKTASVREQELQVQYGYRVDNIPYWKTLKNNKKAFTSEVQKKRVDNTDYKAFQKKRVDNTDYKAFQKQRVANTDYKVVTAKRVANTDYKAFQAQKVANFDYKAKVLNTDYKAFQKQRITKIEKSVLQFDKQGNFIKQWDSIKKASVVVNGFDSSIHNCLKGRVKSAGGYVWKYTN
jgi:hypothetical protein